MNGLQGVVHNETGFTVPGNGKPRISFARRQHFLGGVMECLRKREIERWFDIC
jgi:hypothetical protein